MSPRAFYLFLMASHPLPDHAKIGFSDRADYFYSG
jgi:hypothetical protein